MAINQTINDKLVRIFGAKLVSQKNNTLNVSIGYFDVTPSLQLDFFLRVETIKEREIGVVYCNLNDNFLTVLRRINLDMKDDTFQREIMGNFENRLLNFDSMMPFTIDFEQCWDLKIPSQESNIWTKLPYLKLVYQMYGKFFDKETVEFLPFMLCAVYGDYVIPVDELKLLLKEINKNN